MITVIIPAFNEQDAITQVIQNIQATLTQSGHSPFEIIVIDDGSGDDTGIKAKEAGAKLITHLNNLGYGKSIKDGIVAARYDMIVITDSDGTYPIDQIPLLVDEYKKGYDMVVGARQGKYLDSSLMKGLLRRILKWIVEFTTGRNIPDINSGLRVFSKKEAQTFFNNLSNSFSFTTSLTLAYMLTYKLSLYIPIQYNERVGSTKVRLGRDSLRTLQFVIEVILFYNPIKVFICFSFGLFLGAVFLLVLASISPFFPLHWPALSFLFPLGVSCFALSILILGIGFLSIQLKHILHALMARDSGRTMR